CADADCTPSPLGHVGIRAGRIVQIGSMKELHGTQRTHDERDCEGALLTPGLIDCHTHLVYAGDRAREFELRLQGATYEEIARAGGGIRSTVRLTREASEAHLLETAERRLKMLMRHG